VESLDARLAQVAAWLESALARHEVAAPVTAIGFSNGGMMAGSLVAARPDLVGAAALLSSGYPLPPHVYALGGLAGRRVLILGGDADPFHTVDTLRAGAAAYRDAGAEVEAVVEPGAGHGVTQAQAAHLTRWLGAG
jgi:phospholipase/carboxylesterase